MDYYIFEEQKIFVHEKYQRNRNEIIFIIHRTNFDVFKRWKIMHVPRCLIPIFFTFLFETWKCVPHNPEMFASTEYCEQVCFG